MRALQGVLLVITVFVMMRRGNKYMKKLVILTVCMVTCIIVCLTALTSCEPKEEEETETIETPEIVVETETTVEETETAQISGNLNLLTGNYDLPDEAVGKRPVAVMVNNVADAMPQYGVSAADIIFEVPVEAGYTRLLAIYADYQALPDICSVRSYRSYFPSLCLGLDAVYIHWGEDESMMSYYYSLDMTSYDGMSDSRLFGRDQSRLNSGYSLEHTSVFYGTKLAGIMETDGVRTDLADDYAEKTAFNFVSPDTKVMPSAEDSCTTVYISFGSMSATLEYDEESETYKKKINGSNQVDGVTGEQLSFTNVIILETEIWTRDDGKHKNMNLNNVSGYSGYYVSCGSVQSITWSKGSEYSNFVLYDEDGNELEMNTGKTYIAITTSGMASFE